MTNPNTPKQAAAVIVKVLTLAIPHLTRKRVEKGDKYTHICNAIGRTKSTMNTMNTMNEEDFTRQYIMRGIDFQYTFTDWLDCTHGKGFCDTLSYEQIQGLRHRWVRKLIRDLKKEYLT